MSRADDLRMKIAEIEDEIADAEFEEQQGIDPGYDIDAASARLLVLRDELEEEEAKPGGATQ